MSTWGQSLPTLVASSILLQASAQGAPSTMPRVDCNYIPSTIQIRVVIMRISVLSMDLDELCMLLLWVPSKAYSGPVANEPAKHFKFLPNVERRADGWMAQSISIKKSIPSTRKEIMNAFVSLCALCLESL